MILRVVTKTWCPLAFHRKFSWESSSFKPWLSMLNAQKGHIFPFSGRKNPWVIYKELCLGHLPLFLCSIVYPTIIHLFGNKKRTGAEMCPAVVSGIITGDVPVSYWSVTVPSDHFRSLCSMQRKLCLMAQG